MYYTFGVVYFIISRAAFTNTTLFYSCLNLKFIQTRVVYNINKFFETRALTERPASPYPEDSRILCGRTCRIYVRRNASTDATHPGDVSTSDKTCRIPHTLLPLLLVLVVLVVVMVVVVVVVLVRAVAAVAVIGARPPAAAPGVQCARSPAVTHSATLVGVRSRSAGALLLLAP